MKRPPLFRWIVLPGLTAVTVAVGSGAHLCVAQPPLDAAIEQRWPARREGTFFSQPGQPGRLPTVSGDVAAGPPHRGIPSPPPRQGIPHSSASTNANANTNANTIAKTPAAHGAAEGRADNVDAPQRSQYDLASLSRHAHDQPATASAPKGKTPELVETAQIVAVVGDQTILAGDLLGQINQLLQPYVGQVPEDELNQQRQRMIRQLLPGAIETKLAYLDFLRGVPAERLPEIQDRLYKQFDEHQLEELIEKAQVTSAAKLDAKLREFGSSLEKQRRAFAEQLLAREMIRRNIDRDEEVTHDQMLGYYREHAEDYAIPAAARWEQLTARFSKFPSKTEAYRAVAEMGNQVLRGAPFAAVARKSSQGSTAEQGGQHDWTTQGSLVSEVLNEAIFTVPAGRLSRILEDEKGFHIIRVVERRDAGSVPFVEAQIEIKETIRKQRVSGQAKAYLAKLREQTLVWTVFDTQPPGDAANIPSPTANFSGK